jgi:hypothetical protein
MIYNQNRQPQQQQPHPNKLTVDTKDLPPLPLNIEYHSPGSERTMSNASSLLAKRVGPDRAANMAIPTNINDARWRRDGLLSPEMATPKRTGDLPATPIWQPKLTPTRRGDDLFLGVE